MTSLGEAAVQVAFPSLAINPFVVRQSPQDENAIHRWRVQHPTVQDCISGGSATIVAVLDGGEAAITVEHRVCKGELPCTVSGSAQLSHWYDAIRAWSRHWLRQVGCVCENASPWCTHPASKTSHVAVQNAAGRALIPCFGNVSTGTGQCDCAHKIELQHQLGSHLLATSLWLANEHQVSHKQTANGYKSMNVFFFCTSNPT